MDQIIQDGRDALAQRCCDAFTAGTEAARRLKIGDVFVGAWGAAAASGLSEDGPERRCFTEGFLTVLHVRWPAGVVTRWQDNVIVREG